MHEYVNNLAVLMEKHRWTPTTLAKASGVSRDLLVRIRDNPRHNIQVATITKLCNAMGLFPWQLMSWNALPEPEEQIHD